MIRDVLAFLIRLLTGAQRRQTGSADGGATAAQKPRVYFANHTSMLDFGVLWALLPSAERARTRPVAAHDYWARGRIRHWVATQLFRAVLIERVHVTRANNPLEPLFAALEQGESLIIFPEGGRQETAELRPFKGGIFHLAQRHPAAELVPVYIDNLNRVLPKGEILPIPLMCGVTFGEAMKLEDGETKQTFLVRAQKNVADLQRNGNETGGSTATTPPDQTLAHETHE